jgi:hypothetical protein
MWQYYERRWQIFNINSVAFFYYYLKIIFIFITFILLYWQIILHFNVYFIKKNITNLVNLVLHIYLNMLALNLNYHFLFLIKFL